MRVSDHLVEVLRQIIKFGLSEAEGSRYFDERIRSDKKILEELLKLDWAPQSFKFFLKLHSTDAPRCPDCGTRMNVDCPAARCPRRDCKEAIYLNYPESDEMCKTCVSYKMRSCPFPFGGNGRTKGEKNAKRKEEQGARITRSNNKGNDSQSKRQTTEH